MNKKHNWIIFLALTFLILIIRLPSLNEPLDNDSGAVAFHARQMLRGESLYGKFHPSQHLPGIFLTYELAFSLFGDNQIAPKVLLIIWVITCAYLLYWTGNLIVNELTGIVGGVFYILVSSQVLLQGMNPKNEHFANLALTAGVFLLIRLIRNGAPPWQFVWIGLLSAICILHKIIFITPLVIAVISIIATAWLQHDQNNAWKIAFWRCVWLGSGLIVPLAFIGAYYASIGLWSRLLLVFTIGLGYINNPTSMSLSGLPPPFGFSFFWMGANNIALLAIGLMGTFRFARRVFPFRDINNLINLILVLWLIVSFALAGMRGGGFAYYILIVVPPLSFMGAAEVGINYQRWKNTLSPRATFVGTSFLITFVVANFVSVNLDLYSHYISYMLGKTTYKEYLYSFKGAGKSAWAAETVAEYIANRTLSDDAIYVWSIDVQIYYFADRNPPIDIIWPNFVAATGSPERIFTPKTKYIIVDAPEKMVRPEWLTNGLVRYYMLEAIVADKEIYRRTHQ